MPVEGNDGVLFPATFAAGDGFPGGYNIDPPEGDMRLYLDSLGRLRDLGLRMLLPSHGEPIEDPDRLLGFYLAHRLERESRVVSALAAGAGPVEQLLPRAYPDVAPLLHPLAARSLLAHLLKLREEGRAVENPDGVWATGPAR